MRTQRITNLTFSTLIKLNNNDYIKKCKKIHMHTLLVVGCSGVTGKFFWGSKVTYPDFFPALFKPFPGENFHFGRPKKSFTGFLKVKSKKKKGPPPVTPLVGRCPNWSYMTVGDAKEHTSQWARSTLNQR